jgi:hypothetical protein
MNGKQERVGLLKEIGIKTKDQAQWKVKKTA